MTFAILLLTVLLSISAFYKKEIYNQFIFSPYIIRQKNQWYRFITSGFIHADWMHLLVNMMVLYSFGYYVEEYYQYIFADKGWYYFLWLYIGGMIIAVVPTYYKYNRNPSYQALGASGAVSAIVFSSILMEPLQKVYFFGVIGIPGVVFGLFYLAYSYYMDKKSNDQVNHGAHFWGAIYGVLLTIVLQPQLALHFYYRIIGRY